MRKSWTADLEGIRHTVELEQSAITCRGAITVDGLRVARISQWRSLGSDHAFDLAGHQAVVHVRQGWAGLSIDGLDPATGDAAAVPRSVSIGYLVLGVACISAPVGLVSTFGVASLPASVIGGLGGGLIMAVGRTPWPRARRITTAVGLAVASLCASLAVAVTVSGLTALPSDRPVARWNRFTVGDLSAALPSVPTTTSQSTPTSGGISIDFHVSEFDDAHSSFALAFAELPIQLPDTEAALAGMAQGIETRVGGRIVNDTAFSIDGVAGREIEIAEASLSQGPRRTVYARVLLRGARLYELIAAIPSSGSPTEATVRAFFSSMKFEGP